MKSIVLLAVLSVVVLTSAEDNLDNQQKLSNQIKESNTSDMVNNCEFCRKVMEMLVGRTDEINMNVSSAKNNQPIVVLFNVSPIINNYYNNTYINSTILNSTGIEYLDKNISNKNSSSAIISLINRLSGPGLEEQCSYNRDCYNVPYSECILGKCSCKPNSLSSNGRCFGLLGEKCEVDFDCGTRGASCQSNYCTCKSGFYSPDTETCHRFAKGLGDFCESAQGCHEIKHSICSNSLCECKSNYQRKNNQCLGLINATCYSDEECAIKYSICRENICQCPQNFYLDNDTCFKSADHYGTTVDTVKGCQSLKKAVYVDGKCEFKLHARCNYDHHCDFSLGECFNDTCRCRFGYFEHKNNCYSPYHGLCYTPRDCPTVWQTCIDKICKDARFIEDFQKVSSKPDVTAVFENKYRIDVAEYHYFVVENSHKTNDAGNLAWVKNYTLDRIVAWYSYGPSEFIFWCRAITTNGTFVPGKVTIPGDGACDVDYKDEKFLTHDYSVYIDLGYK